MAWEAQPGPQASAISADWCDELFYGGERGGGKSDFQLGYQEDGALRYSNRWRGIMFRKTYPEMEELQGRGVNCSLSPALSTNHSQALVIHTLTAGTGLVAPQSRCDLSSMSETMGNTMGTSTRGSASTR